MAHLLILEVPITAEPGNFLICSRKLFDNCGFKPCAPFAHYKEDINSLYLTKLLEND